MPAIPVITTVAILPAPVPVTLPKPVTLDAIRKIIREELSANAALEAAARQALEALEAGPGVDPIFAGETEAALRAALAQHLMTDPRSLDEALPHKDAVALCKERVK